MESKKQSSLGKLNNLRKFLKQSDLEDIVIFGSFVKDKFQPNDIDIALLMYKKNYDIAVAVKEEVRKTFRNVHMTVVLFSEFYTKPIWKSIIAEGFSIKKNKFLKDVIGIKPMEIYQFQLDKMTASEKTMFNRGFNEIVKSTGSLKLGAGSVAVPEQKSGQMNDFFDYWQKAKKKVYKTVFL
ncbi:nucleotidyltransferase domain-containing protein [Candidatus Woesearchaeota archaeon]|nr:nucleotidyltransferase domain-containing protein [Candidatus Woesearchaeota archaeon]